MPSIMTHINLFFVFEVFHANCWNYRHTLLNIFDCFVFQTFMDLQFPNGQLTYVAGEGLTTSAFLPVFGGLLQAQSQYPGETKFSFSCKVAVMSQIL